MHVLLLPTATDCLSFAWEARAANPCCRHLEETYYQSSDDEGKAATDDIDEFERKLRGDAPATRKPTANPAPRVSARDNLVPSVRKAYHTHACRRQRRNQLLRKAVTTLTVQVMNPAELLALILDRFVCQIMLAFLMGSIFVP